LDSFGSLYCFVGFGYQKMKGLALSQAETQEAELVGIKPIPQNNWWKIGFLVTTALFLATAGVFGFFVFKTRGKTQPLQPTQVPILTPTFTPTPTPTPTPIVFPTLVPTPDSTANWKTYTNTKYGYSIKYPPEFNYKISGKGEAMVVFDPSQEVLKSPAAEDKALVIITADTSKPVIDKTYYGEPTQIAEETKVTIDGEIGQQVVFSKPIAWIQTVVSHGQRSFYFNLQNMQYHSEYNQILSTFKFLE